MLDYDYQNRRKYTSNLTKNVMDNLNIYLQQPKVMLNKLLLDNTENTDNSNAFSRYSEYIKNSQRYNMKNNQRYSLSKNIDTLISVKKQQQFIWNKTDDKR